MASLEERIYELGAEALAEQERLVVETRARGATIIAAAVVIASLLAGPVFRRGQLVSATETAATVVGLAGCAGVLVCVALLLRPRDLGFSVKPIATYRSLWDRGITDPSDADIVLAESLEERKENNRPTVERLALLLALALASLMFETVGLALAATISSL
jgi:hypothetical protein